jgi:hypothetical protein
MTEKSEERSQASQLVNDYEAEPPPDWEFDGEPPETGLDGYPIDDAAIAFDYLVDKQLELIRIRTEAKRRFDIEDNPPAPIPDFKRLDVLLAEPVNPIGYRIDRVAPIDGRIILSGQGKTGKSQIIGNLVRSLVDGDDFMGSFTVNVVAKQVVLIDDELGENRLREWLRDQGVINTSAVTTIDLRGRCSSFNILDEKRRAEWAERLRSVGCDYLILDCLRPILDSLGLDEHHDAGRFLNALDALITEANTKDALVSHHMGHNAERSRGDSRIEDWPDATWRIVREDPDNQRSPRFFRAYGRDVDLPEGRIVYDLQTRRITYADGNRGDAKTEAALKAVIPVLVDESDLSQRAVEDALGGDYGQKAIRAALKLAVSRGLVSTEPGPRRSTLHRIARPCSECGWPLSAAQETTHLSCADAQQEILR